MARPPSSSWQRGLHESAPYLGLAWQMLSALVFFGGGGLWLDRRLGWTPWGILLGMGLAFVAIGGLLYRIVKQSNATTARRNYAALRSSERPGAKDAQSPDEGSMKSTDASGSSAPNRP